MTTALGDASPSQGGTSRVTPTTEHRATADRDTLNGLVRLLVLDPDHAGQVAIHWLTDIEADDLAADLGSLHDPDTPCDDCGRPDRACRCVAFSTEPADDPYAA
jgi:hypothetical protein